MQFIRSWLLSFVFAALAGTLVHLLAPNGATKHSMKIVVSIFLLCSICSPLASLRNVDFRLPALDEAAVSAQAQPLESTALRQAADALEQAIYNIILQELEAQDIKFEEIAVTADILDNNSIGITKAFIRVAAQQTINTQSLTAIEQRIRNESGMDVKIELY